VPDECERCDRLRERVRELEGILMRDGPGAWNRKRLQRMRELYADLSRRAGRQQHRADRMESRAIKAERQLRLYERRMPPRWWHRAWKLWP
jgi:hypothetical protein